jgi:hypothetical protein
MPEKSLLVLSWAMRWGSGGQRQNVSLYFSMQLSFLFVCFRIWQFLDYTPTSFKNIFLSLYSCPLFIYWFNYLFILWQGWALESPRLANENIWHSSVSLWNFQRHFTKGIWLIMKNSNVKKTNGHLKILALVICFYYRNSKNAVLMVNIIHIIHYFCFQTDLLI